MSSLRTINNGVIYSAINPDAIINQDTIKSKGLTKPIGISELYSTILAQLKPEPSDNPSDTVNKAMMLTVSILNGYRVGMNPMQVMAVEKFILGNVASYIAELNVFYTTNSLPECTCGSDINSLLTAMDDDGITISDAQLNPGSATYSAISNALTNLELLIEQHKTAVEDDNYIVGDIAMGIKLILNARWYDGLRQILFTPDPIGLTENIKPIVGSSLKRFNNEFRVVLMKLHGL